jgi:hypothetical protein
MQSALYSPYLPDYMILFNNLADKLICTLDFNGNLWESKITQNDLTSQMINLTKLTNIIKQNSQKVSPNYLIQLELVPSHQTNSHNLILQIKYSYEFIEWEEKIIFKQKNTLDEATQSNQNAILSRQQKQIDVLVETNSRQQKQIDMLLEVIGDLKNKINELEETNQFYTMYDDWNQGIHRQILINGKTIKGTSVNVNGTNSYIPINLPKNIQCVNIIINSNVKRYIFEEEDDIGVCISNTNTFGPDFNLNISIK